MTAQALRTPPVSTNSRALRIATWPGPALARHIGEPIEVLETRVNPAYGFAAAPVCVRMADGAVRVVAVHSLAGA